MLSNPPTLTYVLHPLLSISRINSCTRSSALLIFTSYGKFCCAINLCFASLFRFLYSSKFLSSIFLKGNCIYFTRPESPAPFFLFLIFQIFTTFIIFAEHTQMPAVFSSEKPIQHSLYHLSPFFTVSALFLSSLLFFLHTSLRYAPVGPAGSSCIPACNTPSAYPVARCSFCWIPFHTHY